MDCSENDPGHKFLPPIYKVTKTWMGKPFKEKHSREKNPNDYG